MRLQINTTPLTVLYLAGAIGWSSAFAGLPTVAQSPAAPQIQVFNGTNVITDGQTSPVDFGSVQQNLTGPIVTFTVTNSGGETL